jgi:hypothetical protein
MIELMLEAERALAVGLLDQAERHYATVVANDPRNAIAVVGLARVALERGDQLGAYLFARKALSIDPDNPMASHLARRMAEQFTGRGEPIPGAPIADAPVPAEGPASEGRPVAPPAPPAPPAPAAPAPPGATRAAQPEPRRRPGMLDRLRGRGR